MTPAELDRIKRLCEAATPAPWLIEREEDPYAEEDGALEFPRSIGPIARWEHVLDGMTDAETAQIEADASFVAAARADVPALVSEVRVQADRAETAERRADTLLSLVTAGETQLEAAQEVIRVLRADLAHLEALNAALDANGSAAAAEVRRLRTLCGRAADELGAAPTRSVPWSYRDVVDDVTADLRAAAGEG